LGLVAFLIVGLVIGGGVLAFVLGQPRPSPTPSTEVARNQPATPAAQLLAQRPAPSSPPKSANPPALARESNLPSFPAESQRIRADFDRVIPGMTADEAIAILGPPTARMRTRDLGLALGGLPMPDMESLVWGDETTYRISLMLTGNRVRVRLWQKAVPSLTPGGKVRYLPPEPDPLARRINRLDLFRVRMGMSEKQVREIVGNEDAEISVGKEMFDSLRSMLEARGMFPRDALDWMTENAAKIPQLNMLCWSDWVTFTVTAQFMGGKLVVLVYKEFARGGKPAATNNKVALSRTKFETVKQGMTVDEIIQAAGEPSEVRCAGEPGNFGMPITGINMSGLNRMLWTDGTTYKAVVVVLNGRALLRIWQEAETDSKGTVNFSPPEVIENPARVLTRADFAKVKRDMTEKRLLDVVGPWTAELTHPANDVLANAASEMQGTPGNRKFPKTRELFWSDFTTYEALVVLVNGKVTAVQYEDLSRKLRR
jgi:hypothetical protein